MFWKFVVSALVLPLSLGLEVAAASVTGSVKDEALTQSSIQLQAHQGSVNPILSEQQANPGELKTTDENNYQISHHRRHYRRRYYRRYHYRPRHYRRHYYRRHYHRPYYRGVYYRNCPNHHYYRRARYRRVYRHGVGYPYYYNGNYRRHYYYYHR
jgi:hypothetical protein